MGKIMLNGKQYGVGGIERAEDISYDNTQSGMSATNVQGALDEVKSGLADIRFIATQAVASSSITIAANSTTPMTIPVTMSGWTPLGIVGYDIQSGWLIPINMSIGGNGNATVWVRNTSTASVTVTPSVIVLYKKNI